MADQDLAYVLHSVPYKETSLVVELFTRQAGRLPVIAKGAKRRTSQLKGVLVSFQPLGVRYTGKSEVRTLMQAEWAGSHLAPEGRALFAAYYLNELLIRGLNREDPHTELFDLYATTLQDLSVQIDLHVPVRRFELGLLAGLGYGLDYTQDAQAQAIDAQRFYTWQTEQGWKASAGNTVSGIKGTTILALADAKMSLDMALELKGLTRQLLHLHVAPQGLLSRAWMEQLHKND
ncbi:MAG: DNA repair protein RecO [Limnobacter sp.]|nr:DNA repair protein RecO [Limnobacter sp.]